MQSGKGIKVIKRGERGQAQATVPQKGVALTADKGESRRDAVKVVTDWIRELRRRKVAEAGRGFESLFSQSAAGAARG